MAYLVIFFNFVFGFCKNYMHHEGIMRTWNTIMLTILTQQQLNAHTWATHWENASSKRHDSMAPFSTNLLSSLMFLERLQFATCLLQPSISYPGEEGTTRWGRNFDQKQKLGVKLPNPWDKNSIQSSPPRDNVFSLKLSTWARISRGKRRCLHCSHCKEKNKCYAWFI